MTDSSPREIVSGLDRQNIYRFRPMVADDLPLVRRWLETAHVSEWWTDLPEEFTFDGDDPAVDQFIVVKDDRSFAYLQCYDQSAGPDNGLGLHPTGTRGIDQFIGEADMVGCGHGSAFIRAFTDRLLATGTPRVITDPDPGNARAVRAYEKAGFRKEREVDTPDGRALLMVRNA
jgi:aminoglycoside 6'-N-acetyltransferase